MGAVRWGRVPSPSMIVAIAALVVALGGSAVAIDRAGNAANVARGKNSALPKNSVTAKQIAPNAVATSELKNGAIAGVDVGPATLTGDLIAPQAVTSQLLAPEAVTSQALAAGAVGTEKLAAEAVTNAKVKEVSGGKLLEGTVGSTQLGAAAVTAPKIASEAVIASKLAEIPGAKIAAGSIDSAQLALGAVTGPKLADEAVTTSSIASSLPRVAVRVSGNITVSPLSTNNAYGDFVWDVEDYDPRSMHPSSGTAPGPADLVAPEDGVYQITLNAAWAAAGGTARAIAINRSMANNNFQTAFVDGLAGPPSQSGQTQQSLSTVVELDEDDRIFAYAFAFGLGSSSTTIEDARFTMEWIGPPTS